MAEGRIDMGVLFWVDLNVPVSVQAVRISSFCVASQKLDMASGLSPSFHADNVSPLIEPDSMSCNLQNISLEPLRRDAQLSTDGEGVVDGDDACDATVLAFVRPGGKIPDPVNSVYVAVDSGKIKLTVVSRNQERHFELNAFFRERRGGCWRC